MGGLREVKQPAVFLDLARRVPHVRFVMVGGSVPSDPQYAAKIRDAARSIPNLTLTGQVPQREVVRILRSASILVNTSRFEGFPNAFLEAWAAGSPVVSLVDVDGHWRMTVADDGKGFDAQAELEANRDRPSLGLTNVRERMGLLGGSLDIQSNHGGGTTVTLRLPKAARIGG